MSKSRVCCGEAVGAALYQGEFPRGCACSVRFVSSLPLNYLFSRFLRVDRPSTPLATTMRFSLTHGGKGNLKSTATAATALVATFTATPTPSLHGAHGISNHSTISHISSTNITSTNIPTIAFPPPTTSGGLSTFGTLEQPYLPKWLGSSAQAPWGSRSVADSIYDASNVPNTGVTRHYTFNVAASTTDADGVIRDTITVNGQFPGKFILSNLAKLYLRLTSYFKVL